LILLAAWGERAAFRKKRENPRARTSVGTTEMQDPARRTRDESRFQHALPAIELFPSAEPLVVVPLIGREPRCPMLDSYFHVESYASGMQSM